MPQLKILLFFQYLASPDTLYVLFFNLLIPKGKHTTRSLPIMNGGQS